MLPAWDDSESESGLVYPPNRARPPSSIAYPPPESRPGSSSARQGTTYHSEIYTDISSKPYSRSQSARNSKEGLTAAATATTATAADKEAGSVDEEIKASQSAAQKIIYQQQQQQQEFDELNCRQWMHNVSEKVSTLTDCLKKVIGHLASSGDIDREVGYPDAV